MIFFGCESEKYRPGSGFELVLSVVEHVFCGKLRRFGHGTVENAYPERFFEHEFKA
jgi:hypothetical protein